VPSANPIHSRARPRQVRVWHAPRGRFLGPQDSRHAPHVVWGHSLHPPEPMRALSALRAPTATRLEARHASRALPEHSTPTSAVLRKPSAPGAMQGAISLLTSMANSSPAPSAKLALSPIPLGNRHAVPVLSANMQRQMAKQSATHVPSANPIHSRARPRQVRVWHAPRGKLHRRQDSRHAPSASRASSARLEQSVGLVRLAPTVTLMAAHRAHPALMAHSTLARAEPRNLSAPNAMLEHTILVKESRARSASPVPSLLHRGPMCAAPVLRAPTLHCKARLYARNVLQARPTH
jgi:hypothetical protein